MKKLKQEPEDTVEEEEIAPLSMMADNASMTIDTNGLRKLVIEASNQNQNVICSKADNSAVPEHILLANRWVHIHLSSGSDSRVLEFIFDKADESCRAHQGRQWPSTNNIEQ